jgi:hypothetical protein
MMILLSDLTALIAAGTYLLIYLINIINNNNWMERALSMDSRRFMKNMDNLHNFWECIMEVCAGLCVVKCVHNKILGSVSVYPALLPQVQSVHWLLVEGWIDRGPIS